MRTRLTLPAAAAAALSFALLCAPARAQEAISTESATGPSTGAFYYRTQLRFSRSTNDPVVPNRDIDQIAWVHRLTYGIDTDLSVGLTLPIVQREVKIPGAGDSHTGLDDFSLEARWRFLRLDHGPLDTTRVALIGGLEIPSGDNDLSSRSLDPYIGAAATLIRGRHGLSADVFWKFTTSADEFTIRPGDSEADSLRYDTAYLFRLAPASFDASSHGAWYAMIECNGLYETNGDNEIMISPGIMYEGRRWVLEAGVQLPAWQEVSHRPERDFVVIVGLRLFF